MKTVWTDEYGRQIPVEYKFNYSKQKLPHVEVATKCIEEGQPFLLRSDKHENGAVVYPSTRTIYQIRNGENTHVSTSNNQEDFFIILAKQIMGYNKVELLPKTTIMPMIDLDPSLPKLAAPAKINFRNSNNYYIRIIKWAKRLKYWQVKK